MIPEMTYIAACIPGEIKTVWSVIYNGFLFFQCFFLFQQSLHVQSSSTVLSLQKPPTIQPTDIFCIKYNIFIYLL